MPGKKPLRLGIDNTKTTVAEAQDALKPHVHGAGVICPCCLQLVKLYEREITVSMAYVAILLHRHFVESQAWLHVPEYLSNLSKIGSAVRGGDWAKLRYWGLIEEKPEDKRKDGSRRSGYYKMTERGHQFVKGEIKVPRSILLYNEHFLGYGKGEVGIRDCLGKEFDYDDLMAGKLGGFLV